MCVRPVPRLRPQNCCYAWRHQENDGSFTFLSWSASNLPEAYRLQHLGLSTDCTCVCLRLRCLFEYCQLLLWLAELCIGATFQRLIWSPPPHWPNLPVYTAGLSFHNDPGKVTSPYAAGYAADALSLPISQFAWLGLGSALCLHVPHGLLQWSHHSHSMSRLDSCPGRNRR